jgi:hypothetical protein
VTSFLMQQAESRVKLLESLENGERTGNVIEATPADGLRVQHIAVFGHLVGKLIRRSLRFGIPLLLQQAANPKDFGFYR